MANQKRVAEQLEFVTSFKEIMQAYEEISTMKMKKIRVSVVATREYLDRLAQVYADVKASYKVRVSELLTHKKNKRSQTELATLTAFKKNGKSLLVFVSANTKLYGEIIGKVFDEFKKGVSANPGADIMIVGRLGRSLFEESKLGKKYLYFEIPDLDLRIEDLKQIVFHLVQYESVNIFHGRFENMATQKPYISSVSGDVFFKKEEGEKTREEHFLFEPALETLLGFFEAQVFTILFEQSVFEGALARFSSRIMSMEQAITKIEETERALMQEKTRVRRFGEQKKQNERIAGITLWNK